MKSASDMALPAIGVGLLYRKGYFRQTIDADGHQEHDYPDYDLSRLPLGRVQDASGLPLTVTVELPGRDLSVAVWVAQVGRVPVLLLDTDMPENADSDRPITNILYVRGREMRLHQELVLGIGGVRAIRALGLAPAVWHLNEGHSAFLLAERAREYVAGGRPLADAWADVRRNSVFTIHTPVSAGNERFDTDLVRRVAGPLLEDGGVPVDDVLGLGLGVDGDAGQFDMTAFSLRLTHGANAVSHLHAAHGQRDVAGRDGSTRSWASPTASTARPGSASRSPSRSRTSAPTSTTSTPRHRGGRFWERVERIPARDLWDAHLRQKRELAHFARGRLRSQFARHGEAPTVLAELESCARSGRPDHRLRPPLRDLQAGRAAVQRHRPAGPHAVGPDRPIQVVFAGKAHPADRPGQRVIQEIFQRSRSPQLRGRVFILEDYDMRIGRFLVQGVDVWLNNPRRPLEASGTSGMKAAQNGVPNVSVLDGWWDEGFEGDNGWAIGGRETDPDEAAQDWPDAQDLYRILEEEIVPAYYERDASGLPPRWLAVMQRAMASALWRFSTTRMLHEYTELLYLPAAGVSVAAPAAPAATPALVTEAG